MSLSLEVVVEFSKKLALKLCTQSMHVAYSTTKRRFEFSILQYAQKIEISHTCLFAAYIGVTGKNEITPGNPFTAQSPPTLSGPSQRYVESVLMTGSTCLDVANNSGGIPLVLPIDCANIPYGFNIPWSVSDENAFKVDYGCCFGAGSTVNLKTIDIKLTDAYGNELDLPPNAYSDLVFKIWY